MKDRKITWLVYTVVIGLIPVLSRLLLWFISHNRNIDILNTADFVVFGLILHISNINALEHFNDGHKTWKTIQNGTSTVFIVLYGVLFAAYLLDQTNPGLIDQESIRYATMALSFVSFLLSLAAYDRMSKSTEVET